MRIHIHNGSDSDKQMQEDQTNIVPCYSNIPMLEQVSKTPF